MKAKLEERGFFLVEENPELVISYGGDGMFLISERVFPGVPKILIRDSEVGNMTHDFDICKVIDLYMGGKFSLVESRKLKGVRRGKFEVRELIGVNDIVVRNSLPTEAIRFRYRVNEGEWSPVLIGDGIVVSTPYGSNKGAYFYSIVRKKFDCGIGVAFNNVTEERAPLILAADDFLEVELVRGIGVMVADNNRDYINLESGDKIKVHLVDEVARRIVLKDDSC
jgi:NAD+ kinase